ncbi:MAG: metallophosphoesterase [Thermoleophilaceae bacterium]
MVGAEHERRLLAISDLHVEAPENRDFVLGLPSDSSDWLIVCGDVGASMEAIQWALRELAERFQTVIWVPGNHELWTYPDDPIQLRGDQRYRYIVQYCEELGIITPEDPFPVWRGQKGSVVIVPLFLLYDYSFAAGNLPKDRALSRARSAGIVCSDEFLLFSDPFSSVEEWCRERIAKAHVRLEAATQELPSVLVNHFPLLREHTKSLLHPDFAQWCGTTLTADWHTRFRARVVVYGHLHIPRTTVHNGVPFREVSLGYPRQWRRRPVEQRSLRRIFSEGEQT